MSDSSDQVVSPWHAGEKQLQERVGVSERMEEIGRKVLRDYMPDQHREFYRQLPFIVVGAVDNDGLPWASLLDGQPGFIHSPDPQLLDIERLVDATDPLGLVFEPGTAVGLLGIDLHTRRRNRMNGRIKALSDHGFRVEVEQSFGNCPQYIQQRELVPVIPRASTPQVERMGELDAAAQAMIRGADTFFVASFVDLGNDPRQRSVDVSHRGGQTGFVRVDGNLLTIPDFSGNLHFNTLGNLLLNPKAGLLFVDFTSGDMLHISGRAEVLLDGPSPDTFQGAERFWQVRVEHVVRRPAALGLRWRFEGFSPRSLLTGSWSDGLGV